MAVLTSRTTAAARSCFSRFKSGWPRCQSYFASPCPSPDAHRGAGVGVSRCRSNSRQKNFSSAVAGRTGTTKEQRLLRPTDDAKDIRRRQREAQLKAHDESWEANFERLKRNVDKIREAREATESSSSSLPTTAARPLYDPEDKGLRKWLDNQRLLFRYSRRDGSRTPLVDERQAKLEELLGVDLESLRYDYTWEDFFRKLCDFVERNDGKLPYEFLDDPASSPLGREDRKLQWWCQRQKRDYKSYREGSGSTTMTADRVKKLEALGFVFDAKEASWFSQYTALVDYQKQHGDCLVPKFYSPNPALGRWVCDQRARYKVWKRDGKTNNGMSEERYRMLQDLGFTWDVQDARWLDKFQEFQKHVNLNGKGTLPSRAHNISLRRWAVRQRRLYKEKVSGKQTSLTDQREELLNKLGFPWNIESHE